jgi:hypothetical protein
LLTQLHRSSSRHYFILGVCHKVNKLKYESFKYFWNAYRNLENIFMGLGSRRKVQECLSLPSPLQKGHSLLWDSWNITVTNLVTILDQSVFNFKKVIDCCFCLMGSDYNFENI